MMPSGKLTLPEKHAQRYVFRRCLTGVDSRSQGLSKFVAIDKESNHEIMHVLRRGEAQRAADKPFDPGPEMDVLALDLLGIFHIPSNLVVDQWASDGESRSHRDFLVLHDA